MATADTAHLSHGHDPGVGHDDDAPPPAGPLSIKPLAIVGLFALLVATAGIAVVWSGIVPVVLAALVAATLPGRRSAGGRVAMGAITGAIVLFVVCLWPGEATLEGELPSEAGHHLSWIIGLPIAGAIAILFLPRQSPKLLQGTTLAFMFATLALTLPVLGVPMGRTYHFAEDIAWMPRFGIHYHVAIDGISLWLVVLSAFITPIAAYASFGSIRTRIKDWCFALLLLEGAMIGSFLSLDLFLFYVFWELMLIPMYVMIGVWGGAGRIKSAIKFFLYTMFGSMLMLGAILYMAYAYARASGGTPSFDYFDLQRVLIPYRMQFWLWAAFTLAFVIKVPMFPVHTWLPDAHTEAPTAGSIILAAVMLKAGTYGYLRFALGIFPEVATDYAPQLGGVAVLGGIIYGALCAWKQDDVKRLIAYSSVAHLGYVMLGIFALTQASLEGSVLQMVNHGISTGLLFLLFGVIYDRRHTRGIDQFGGLAKPMPLYAALFIIATLASIGLPTTNGFVGEFMIITGSFMSHTLGRMVGMQAVGAAIGVILGAVYMLMVVQKMFFGPVTNKENAHLPDMTERELVAATPLVLMIFVIGLFPNIFLSQIKGAAARVKDDVEARVDAHPGPKYFEGPISLSPPRAESPRVQKPAAIPSAAAPAAPAQAH
jgi:NADH-quinone oxidoreductase subunit M